MAASEVAASGATGLTVVEIQRLEAEERALAAVPEEEFYLMDVPLQPDVQDTYADISVECVEDVLAYDKLIKQLDLLIVDV